MSSLSHLFRFYLFISISFLIPVCAHAAAAPNLLLANVYRAQVELDDYWVSEKLDGVRAYWDGKHLISRQGNILHAPAWFTAGFPPHPLDGELWAGRGTFEQVSGTVRQLNPDDELWRDLRYMVFDLPIPDVTFESRLYTLRKLIADLSIPHLQIVEQYKISDHQALMNHLDEIVRAGGEGLMLHRGGAFYRAARSDDLLKVKTRDDAEGVVIAHLPGKGKYQGMMGSLLIEAPSGIRFKIGTGFSDAQRANPPPVGSLITYKYSGLTKNNIPRFASFLRVRSDIEQTSINFAE